MKYQSGILGGEALVKTLKVGATVAASTIVMTDSTNKYGSIIPSTTTSSNDAIGLAISAGTYDTTPTAAEGGEGTAQVIINPFAIYRGRVWGSATKAELSAATLNVQTQTSASATVITSAAMFSNDKNFGTIFALTGANAGLSRIITSHSDGVSCTVTVAFPNTVAVGDKLVTIQHSFGTSAGQTDVHAPTTDLTGFDDSVALATGFMCCPIGVELVRPINDVNPEIYVDFILTNHLLNPID
jgi:hypothetical protein